MSQGTEDAQKNSPVSADAPDNSALAALIDAWTPSSRLNAIVGNELSKRDKRRVVSVVLQYQFDGTTPEDRIAHFRKLAAREISNIAPHLSVDSIEQLWQVPPRELYSVRGASPSS